MAQEYLVVEQSLHLSGSVTVSGAKNAVLVTIASLILAPGKSVLFNVPNSADVQLMITLMRDFGCVVEFNLQEQCLEVDTTDMHSCEVNPDIVNKMRASILVMGPLLARFGKAKVALPGGCLIGARPIDYHLKGFRKMGVVTEEELPFLNAKIDIPLLHGLAKKDRSTRVVFEYPSVGATENIMMLAVAQPGETVIVNAALEPEVIDLIDVLRKMGADIACESGSIVRIKGVSKLNQVQHTIVPDRLEAGVLLLAACATGGSIQIPNARADHLDIFLSKLEESGHTINVGTHATTQFPLQGISVVARKNFRAVSIKTGVYPGFPTDLQAPMMAMLCCANGVSNVEETVFENRLVHTRELQKMGAQIGVAGSKATIRGVECLYGAQLIATDIRASSALVIAGLAAVGTTTISNVHHWKRGYDQLEKKLQAIGASINLVSAHQGAVVNASTCVEG